jgi:hypothetical protein
MMVATTGRDANDDGLTVVMCFLLKMLRSVMVMMMMLMMLKVLMLMDKIMMTTTTAERRLPSTPTWSGLVTASNPLSGRRDE